MITKYVLFVLLKVKLIFAIVYVLLAQQQISSHKNRLVKIEITRHLVIQIPVLYRNLNPGASPALLVKNLNVMMFDRLVNSRVLLFRHVLRLSLSTITSLSEPVVHSWPASPKSNRCVKCILIICKLINIDKNKSFFLNKFKSYFMTYTYQLYKCIDSS